MRTQTKAVIARLDRAIQHSRDASDDARSRGVLDRPVKPGDDGWGAADSYSPIPTDSNFKQPRCLQTQLRDLAAHPREFVLEFSRPRNQRAQGMPGARCARSLARNKKAHEHSHHGHAGITRAFPAQWFTAYSVLSPVTGFFATVACGSLHRLGASVGASGPHGFAVRLSAVRQERCLRPSHPASRP